MPFDHADDADPDDGEDYVYADAAFIFTAAGFGYREQVDAGVVTAYIAPGGDLPDAPWKPLPKAVVEGDGPHDVALHILSDFARTEGRGPKLNTVMRVLSAAIAATFEPCPKCGAYR